MRFVQNQRVSIALGFGILVDFGQNAREIILYFQSWLFDYSYIFIGSKRNKKKIGEWIHVDFSGIVQNTFFYISHLQSIFLNVRS